MTIEKLDELMTKKWKKLAEKLPYGLQWLTQSAELMEWYEKKKKLLTNAHTGE